MRNLTSLAVLVFLGGPLIAQEKTVTRYVEFRDSSILRLAVVDEAWTMHLVRGTGKIDTVEVTPGQVQDLWLTRAEDFAKKRQLLTTVKLLGSRQFRVRERAWQKLHKMGPAIRPDLQACLEMVEEVEIRVRLRQLLKLIPAKSKLTVHRPFDKLQVQTSRWMFAGWGFRDGAPLRVVIGGKEYPLPRSEVSRLSASRIKPLEYEKIVTVSGFQRISPQQFPKGCIEEAFETDPKTGRKLTVGENIEKLFVPKGFLLSTSIKTSHVSVNTYNVNGKSRGWSAATHQPLWNGVITIRFVRPGVATQPAGVTHFGCYVAAVVPGGTSLVAYDRLDNELGRIVTKANNTEFFGVRSFAPMYKIQIVPNPAKDADYTLDDFIFKAAKPPRTAHRDKFKVHLTTGEMILTPDLSFQQGQAVLHKLPAKLPDRRVSLNTIRRLLVPRKQVADYPVGMYAELRDGSIVFAPMKNNTRTRPEFPGFPGLWKDTKQVVAVWTTSFPRVAANGVKGAAVYSPTKKQWLSITDVAFSQNYVTWKDHGGKPITTTYPNLPPLRLAASTKPNGPRWHVQTIRGEDLVISQPATLTGSLAKGLRATWRGRPIHIATPEWAALYQTPVK